MIQAPLVIVGGTSLFRRGLCSFLQDTPFDLIGEYDDVESCRAAVKKVSEAEIAIYISGGSPVNSAEAVDTLTSCLGAKVLVLSSELSVDELSACVRVGAGGYLLNNISREAFCHSLHLILLGEVIFPSQLASSWAGGQLRSNGSSEQTNLRNPLTPREKDVLLCLTEGLPNKLIARQLGIAELTVKIHVKALTQKIGVQNRTQVALWAVQAGFARDSMSAAA